ncbi:WD40 repeat-like protein [Hesseltinella vesiculosa]|uniref:WD40 repeat-like protein n=1 Tax=Hesseltinella vesiculosa TaxID=101127 RepID=A0A1X2GUH2_9FUNG|nr:WD40 repeat-like protein [Hesseltinella vesiculosa]
MPASMIVDDDMDSDAILEIADDVMPSADQSNDQDTDDLLDAADLALQQKPSSPSGTTTPKRKGKKPAAKPSTDAEVKPKRVRKTKPKGKEVDRVTYFDVERSQELAQKFPDQFWQFHAGNTDTMITNIHEKSPLEPVPVYMNDSGAVTGMTLSPDGTLLATFSSYGSVKVWDVNNDLKLFTKLRDREEDNIDEYYCGLFLPDAPHLLAAAGKLKDRHRWCTDDEDNHIMPCPIKIFDLQTGKVIAKLEGHAEEILSIKAVRFDGNNYYITTSQDGHIMKWKMADDWITLIESQKMLDELTCMAFTVSFVPNTGNKYFLAACDEHVRLYDFETTKLLQTFENLYSSYCDCGKFINWVDEDQHWEKNGKKAPKNEQYAWFITRGAEMCDVEDGVTSTANTCSLHRLVYPKTDDAPFVLEEVHRFKHEQYHANSWLVKITSNGRYLIAPTITGQLFIFNLLTGKLTGILKSHENMEIRDVMFHPYRPLLFSVGDDGNIKAYSYKVPDEDVEMKDVVQQDLDVGKK